MSKTGAACLAALCALASFDALADSGYANAFLGIFLLVAGGVLACIVVEIAAGHDKLGARIALGIGLALLDIVAFLLFLQVYIAASIRLSAGDSSGPAGLIPIVVMPWIIPLVRLWRLRQTPRPSKP